MSKQIEVIFDFLCPYCYEGILQFMDILPEYRDVDVIWQPCESHPRPEYASQHSDLATAAFFYVRDYGGDQQAFVRKTYNAWFAQRKRIDDTELLASIASECGCDREQALKVLSDGSYTKEVDEANIYAWDRLQLEAVPSYICDGHRALSRGGVLVPIAEVKKLME